MSRYDCFLLVIGVSIGFFTCWTELVYLLKGETTVAKVIEQRITERSGKWKFLWGSHARTVQYQLTEPDGSVRLESDCVGSNGEEPEVKTILVQYLPGVKGRSRLAGHYEWEWIAIFFLSLIVLGTLYVKHVRQRCENT